MSSESPDESTHQPILSQLVHSIFSSSDDNDLMMAAIISLLVVLLFVFILHLYARCSFHSHTLRRRRRRHRNHRTSALTIPSLFAHDLPPLSGSATKGLEPSAISAIPLFVYEAAAMGTDDDDDEAECVICLTEFEGGDVYRKLPKCGHEFHVECVDMWLRSHSNCPICRAPAMAMVPELSSISSEETDSPASAVVSSVRSGDGFLTIDIVTATVDNNNNNNNNNSNSSGVGNDCSSSSFGYSLKRMLSRTRSERKASLAACHVVCSSSSSTDQSSRE